MVTMNEVAKRAGVSMSTVSHVLNGTRHVNPNTRVRVEQAISELGYRQDPAARMLAGGRSGTIGLVISGLTNPYFGPLLHTIEQEVSDAGYVLVLGDSHDEHFMEQQTIDSLVSRRVDGLIVAPSAGFTGESAQRIAETGTPLVLIDRALPVECDKVTPENREAVRTLTEHLIEHGHRRIAVVTGLRGIDSTEERRQGYIDALAAHDLPIDPALMLDGQSDRLVAQSAVADLLRGSDRPTALLPLNNAMTIGAMRAMRDAKLGIPDDIALCAYDDFEWSDLFRPGLTAMGQDVARMGTEAVALLLRRIGGDSSEFEHHVISPAFHRRDSCGCPSGD
ncbi:LacI family DNA-binding transcriptional regulator [Microbacterium horticulturae]|uniref:LacI family DNA-binding transcriptional regulator n=1 Tax=Microbacterium horticulturae TaxID=3028316 RepID=A0ABY8BVF6_9MICO|nr:LacI family DNA-binding transcriptional regulator [Microbacterium sp. KACC 23027]WEG08151.1 LacI family DNA-binding transcriptional regulator [Microbacterium sp. KACC 23027]